MPPAPRKRWLLRDADPQAVAYQSQQLKVSALLARILILRGYSDGQSAKRYLSSSLREDLPSPFEMIDMEAAVVRLVRAIEHKEQIGIWGDYDVDGTTGASLLVCFLRALGAQHTEVIRLRLPDTGLAWCEDRLTGRLRELADGFDVCLAPWLKDAHADHEAAGRAARRACEATFGYPVWMWHWAYPGDRRVPWHRVLRVPLPPAIAAAKRAAIQCFASQVEYREPDGSPVLTPGVVAHFTRAQEVLFG